MNVTLQLCTSHVAQQWEHHGQSSFLILTPRDAGSIVNRSIFIRRLHACRLNASFDAAAIYFASFQQRVRHITAVVPLDFNLTKAAFTRTVNEIDRRQPNPTGNEREASSDAAANRSTRSHVEVVFGGGRAKNEAGLCWHIGCMKKTNMCLCLPQWDFVMQEKPNKDFYGACHPALWKKKPKTTRLF